MTKRVLTSPSASQRLREAGRFIDATVDGATQVLVLAPRRGAADDLLRRVCRERGEGGGLFGVHRTTPLQLASELATRAMAGESLAPVSSLGVEALAARAIAHCRPLGGIEGGKHRHEAGELAYFEPVAQTPGLARALAATLRELRVHGVEGGELEHTGAPGADLARLLAAYEKELQSRRLADDALVLELARRELVGGVDHYLVGLPLLALDLSPTDAAERRFLAALAAHVPTALATAVAGDDDGLAALEEVFETTAETLEEPGASTALVRLRRRIFAPEITDGNGDGASDESVVFLTAAGEGRECVEIVRRIRDLAAEGHAYDRAAILLRAPEAYLPLVEEALRRARVPAYFTRGTVRPHASGRAFLALLACAAEGFSASRFAEYLSLGQVPKLEEGGAPPVLAEVPWVESQDDQLVFKSFLRVTHDEEGDEDQGARIEQDAAQIVGTLRVPRRWEELLVDAAVLGGRDRWERRLDGLDAEIELQLRELGEEEPAKRDRLLHRRRELKNLRRFALPVISDLAELPEKATWGVWLDKLGRLAGRVLRQHERVLSVLAELRPMEEVGPVGLDEVRRVLEDRLKFLRTEPPPRRYGRVFVATVEEARGRDFETVFLPGLAEGIFPRRASEDPLLLDDARRRLDAGLLVQAKRIARERLLLRIAAGAASERLVVSYPNLDAVQGRSRVPSFYALDLLRAAEGRLPRLRELETRASRETAALLGWPAPGSPERAIDDAEFDLSTLEPLMHREPEETTSRARYLLEWNEPLRRSLRARYLRWKAGSKITWADGLVDPADTTRAALEANRVRNRSYSPTALQSFAQCPYRFLLYAIHRLRPREEAAPLEQMDPLTRGSLFHEVQFKLFGQLKEKDLLPMREENLPQLFDLADAQLQKTAERYHDQLAPAIERVWESEVEGLKTDLRGWIRTMVNAREAWRPSHFELSFGLPVGAEHDASSHREEVVVLDGVRLRGSIDLVETDDARQLVRVTDHKTGKAIFTRRLVVKGGEVLQPLLYALVAEQLLGRPVEEGRLFYCTRRGDYQELKVRIDDEGRRSVAEVVQKVDKAIADGFLPAAPRERACRFCDYQLVCGPNEEMRLERKRKEQLRSLEDLRKMP